MEPTRTARAARGPRPPSRLTASRRAASSRARLRCPPGSLRLGLASEQRLRLLESEGLVERPDGGLDLILGDHSGDADLRRRDDLDVDAGLGERREHLGGVARGILDPGADDGDLGHGRVGRHLAEAQLPNDRLEDALGLREITAGYGEAQVCRAVVADVLNDRIDVDAGFREGGENGMGDTGPVRDLDEGHFGHVAVVGQAANLVALLHERILLDERAGYVLERAQHLDDDVVDPAELYGPNLHDLGALVSQFHHLLVGDDRQLAGVGDEPRIGCVDAPNVGEDLAAYGVESGSQSDATGVRTASTESRDLRKSRG